MMVTKLGWEHCLAAAKAVRSFVSPNFSFHQEYKVTLLHLLTWGFLVLHAKATKKTP